LRSCLRTRAALHAEILALRHQLLVLQRLTQGRRLRLKPADSSVLGVAVSPVGGLVVRKTRVKGRYQPGSAQNRLSRANGKDAPGKDRKQQFPLPTHAFRCTEKGFASRPAWQLAIA